MSVAVYQNPWELEMLLRVLTEEDFFENVLEIGAYEGGTLRHWLNLAPEVVIVDDEMRNADLWEAWAEDQHAVLALLQGDSHDPRSSPRQRSSGRTPSSSSTQGTPTPTSRPTGTHTGRWASSSAYTTSCRDRATASPSCGRC